MSASLLRSRCGALAGPSPRCGVDCPLVFRPTLSSACTRRSAADASSSSAGFTPLPRRHANGSTAPRVVCAAASTDAPAAAVPALTSLSISPVVNPQGYIAPEGLDGVQASVFALFDEKQKLQYIGFSKDFASTLRTLFSRRPEKAHFYKIVNFQTLDQAAMIRTRESWFEEAGGQPSGNKLALERNAWQNPMESGARSDRGKEGASLERLNEALTAIKARGCRDEFVADPVMYSDGKIEFLPVIARTPEAIAAAAAAMAATAKLSRKSTALVEGEERPFSVFYRCKLQTRGGYMFDVDVTFEEASSTHRIVIGKEYYEPFDIEPEAAIEAALGLLFAQKEVRQTEGLLLSSQFPVNYFSMSGLEQWFGPAFAANFTHMTGKTLAPDRDPYWRMNRLHDYAGKLDTEEQLARSVGWHN